MKVSQKLLIIGISILLVVSLAVHFFSEYQTSLIKKAYEQIGVVSTISKKLVEAHNAINRFQIDDIINEEYYEEGKSQNLQEYDSIMGVLRNYELKFAEIYRGKDKQKVLDNIRSLLSNINTSFEVLVNAYKTLGHNDYGLEGKFSETRDGFFDILEEVDDHELHVDLEGLRVQEMKFIHRKNEKYRNKIKKALDEFSEIAAKKRLNEVVQNSLNQYGYYIDQYYEQFIKIGLSDDEGLRLDLKSKLKEAEDYFVKISEDSNIAMYKASRNKTIFGLIFIIMGVLVSSVAFYLFSMTVTKPLFLLSVMAKSTADGDLTSQLDSKLSSRKDEIGILAESLNETVRNIKNAVQQIKLSSDKNKQVGEDLRESANLTSNSVEIVSENMISFTGLFRNLDQNIARTNDASSQIISNISSLSERIMSQVTAVEETSAIIEEMSASLNSIANITIDKKKITDNLVTITKDGDARVKETNIIIKEIAESTGKMKELTELINSIASQTNLLSMNAAIEAAHAGDAGKGFSVVAEEIRKLSERTAEGVKGISVYLKTVVEGIEKALVSSENSGKAFGKVNEGVAGSAEAFGGIANMVSEASSGSDEMLKAMSEINQVTQDVKSGANDIKNVLTEMGSELKEIADLSSNGSHEIEKALDAIKEIDINTTNVADLSSSNEQILEELTTLVQKFRVSENDVISSDGSSLGDSLGDNSESLNEEESGIALANGSSQEKAFSEGSSIQENQILSEESLSAEDLEYKRIDEEHGLINDKAEDDEVIADQDARDIIKEELEVDSEDENSSKE